MKKLTALFLILTLLLTTASAFAKVTAQEVLGTVQGGEYTNKYLGFGFHGEGWTFLSPEEIADSYAYIDDLFTGDFKKIVSQEHTITFLLGASPDGEDHIIGTITYLGEAAKTYKKLGLKHLFKLQTPEIGETLSAEDLTDVSAESVSQVINGRKTLCLRTSYTVRETGLKGVQISMIKDQYLITVGFTSPDLYNAEADAALLFWL